MVMGAKSIGKLGSAGAYGLDADRLMGLCVPQ